MAKRSADHGYWEEMVNRYGAIGLAISTFCKRDGPMKFLADFKGFLQADAFAGYDCIFAGGQVREVACRAHAHRKFYDALTTNKAACNEALSIIQQLYAIEREQQRSSSEFCDADPLDRAAKVKRPWNAIYTSVLRVTWQ